MQYINKNNAVSEAAVQSVVVPHIRSGEYRSDCLNGTERWSIRKILSTEQNNLCCYCVREIEEGERTVEHLIPKKVSRHGYGTAIGNFGRGLYRGDILYDRDYTSQSYPAFFPHPLAYGNLTMACELCNDAKRGEDERGLARPLFFANPVVGIRYEDDGMMKLGQADSLPMNLKSRINNSLFVQIRSLWRAFKHSGISVQDVKSATDTPARLALLGKALPNVVNNSALTEIKKRGSFRYTSQGTWTTIISFSWFWGYYK